MDKIANWLETQCRFAMEMPLDQQHNIQVADEAGQMRREHGEAAAALMAEHRSREAKDKGDMFGYDFWEKVKKAIEIEQDVDQQSHTIHPQLS